jgi:hypothetical protein
MATMHSQPTAVRPSHGADPSQRQLTRRAGRLVDDEALFIDRVRRLERDGTPVPQTLRDKLAAFSAELDELREELGG